MASLFLNNHSKKCPITKQIYLISKQYLFCMSYNVSHFQHNSASDCSLLDCDTVYSGVCVCVYIRIAGGTGCLHLQRNLHQTLNTNDSHNI